MSFPTFTSSFPLHFPPLHYHRVQVDRRCFPRILERAHWATSNIFASCSTTQSSPEFPCKFIPSLFLCIHSPRSFAPVHLILMLERPTPHLIWRETLAGNHLPRIAAAKATLEASQGSQDSQSTLSTIVVRRLSEASSCSIGARVDHNHCICVLHSQSMADQMKHVSTSDCSAHAGICSTPQSTSLSTLSTHWPVTIFWLAIDLDQQRTARPKLTLILPHTSSEQTSSPPF